MESTPKNIITSPELQVYVKHFWKSKDDWGLVAEVDGKIVGAVFSVQDFSSNTDTFYSVFNAFDWSISIPDISQSNSRQERFLASDCFPGH